MHMKSIALIDQSIEKIVCGNCEQRPKFLSDFFCLHHSTASILCVSVFSAGEAGQSPEFHEIILRLLATVAVAVNSWYSSPAARAVLKKTENVREWQM